MSSLDEWLLRDNPQDEEACEGCNDEPCTCEPDYEAIAEARAEARRDR